MNHWKGDWEIKAPDKREEFFNNGVPIRIWKKEWEDAVEGTPIELALTSLSSRVHYGILLKQQSKVFDFESMRNHFRSLDQRGMSNNWAWILYRWHNYNFDIYEHLIHILPENRESEAITNVKLLIELTEFYKSNLDKIVGMKLNP